MATSHQNQVNDPELHNWVRCVLGLKYTQEGLYPFIDNEAREFHKNLTANVSAQLGIQSLNCNQCTIKTLLPNHVSGTCPVRKRNISGQRKCICTSNPANRGPCPADVCGRLYDEIVSAHRYGDPAWCNSDMTLWTGNHWEVIKNFLPSTGGYKDISSAVDTDCSGLLNIAINVMDITTRHGIASALDVFVKCRTVRNKIFHSSNKKLSDADRDKFIQIMVDVLECTPALKTDQAAQQAVAKLQQVKSDLYIVTAADIEAAKQEVQHIVAEGLEKIDDKTAESLAQINKKTAEGLEQVGDKTTKSLAQLDGKTKNFAQIYKTTEKFTKELAQLLEKNEDFPEMVDKNPKSLAVSVQNAEGKLQQLQEDGNKVKAVVYQRDGEWNKQGEEDGSCFNFDDDDNIVVNQRDGERNEQDEEVDRGLESDDDDIEAAGVERWSAIALRSYQLELAENALQGRNTIICAGTGSGKTWVALYIVEQHFKQAANAPKKAVFMARTGSLVKQQADRFKKYLQDLKSKLVTGEDDDSKKVGLFLPDNDVIFLTPQTLINNLDNGSVTSLRDFSLLILDECHHTKMDEPYNNLMRKYLMEKGEKNELDLPQVVGLTASIGVGKSSSDAEAYEYIMQMCARLDVRLISTVEKNKEELKKHTAETSEEIVTMADRKQDPCKGILWEAIIETEKKLKALSIFQRSMTRLLCKPIEDKESQEYQKWTLEVIGAAISVDNEELARNIRSCAMYLNVYNAALEVNSLLQKEDVAAYLADRLENETTRKMSDLEKDIYSSVFDVQCKIIGLDYTNPNLNFVRETLYKMLREKGEDSRAMVFVKTRATCRSLASFLDDSFQEYGIKVQPFYGKGAKGADEGMTEAQQNVAIEMFRKGYVQVLVATSIGSEGLDIPDCNIVLSYNYSGNEVTKIQMKGRSRKKGGVHFTFGSEKTINQEKMNVYKAAMMQRALNLFINKQRQSPDVIERKITSFQEEERKTYRFKQEIEKVRQARKKSKDDQEILCIRCAVFLCQLSDVRVFNKSQYVIIDKEFEKRIEVTPHKSPKKYDGLHKKFKMRCKKCSNDLGIVAEYRSLPCRIFKLQSLKFKDCASGHMQTYKDWKTVPYEISEVGEEDLQVFLG